MNETSHNIEGLSLFIKKRVNHIFYKNKANIFSRFKVLKKLARNAKNTGIRVYFYALYAFIALPAVNLLFSLMAYNGLTNVLKELGVLMLSLLLGGVSSFVMSYIFRDKVKNYVEENIFEDIALSKNDVMEIGLYLNDSDKARLAHRINACNKISLKDISMILKEKEQRYEIDFKEIERLRKVKEKAELVESLNVIK